MASTHEDILAAFKVAIEHTTSNRNAIKAFLEELSRLSIYGFLTNEVQTELQQLVYGNDQDEILDFVIYARVMFTLHGVSETDIFNAIKDLESTITKSAIFSNSSLKSVLTVDKNSITDIVIGILFLLRIFVAELNKHNSNLTKVTK